MNTNEIKKSIYKEKPTAKLMAVTKAGIKYRADINEAPESIYFIVPFEDIGDGVFQAEMPAQLLIRYLAIQSPELW